MARSNDDLTLRVGFDIAKFQNELAKTNQSLTKWSAGISGSLKGLAAGFGALSLGRFVMDVSRLAGEAEGVRAAFTKLADSAKLMNDLKQATGGTVSELELMKRSVMASNFDISLKALPQLLEFATLRARQTGQSVDYLVDSIVTGIGRKSKLILDNLGISAVQLTEALGGASAASSTIGEVAEAVGKIASKNLETMGKLTDDAAVRADRLNASWQNLKVTLGQIVNDSGLANFLVTVRDDVDTINKITQLIQNGRFSNSMDELNRQIQIFNESNASMSMKEYGEAYSALAEAAKEANVKLVILSGTIDGQRKSMASIKNNPVIFVDGTKVTEQVRNIKFLEDQIKSLNEEIRLSGSSSQISKYQSEIKALEKEIKSLLGEVEKIESINPFDKLLRKTRPEGLDQITSPKPNVGNPTGFGGAFDETLTHIGDLVDKAKQKGKEFADEWQRQAQRVASSAFMIGEAIGESVGSLVNRTENFAQVVSRMAVDVIRSLKRLAMAYMLANSAKFGIPGIVAAGVGFGLLEAAFSKIGANSGSMTDSMKGGKYDDRRQSYENMSWRTAGTQLVAVSDNTRRMRRRTGN